MKSRGWRFCSISFLTVLAACQTPETKVKTTPERFYSGSQVLAPVKIDAATVVVDARSSFDYSMAHVPHSLSFQWTDFTDAEKPGQLSGDLAVLTRRLALAGISPTTHVVVLGYGVKGQGEEGRIAWTLAYLGVRDVQFADFDAMKFRLTNVNEENLVPSVEVWNPEVAQGLLATADEIKFVINKRGIDKPLSFAPGEPAVLYRLIDVRPSSDYLGRTGYGKRVKVPNFDAVNIPWQEFFDPQMRPITEMSSRLKEVGISPDCKIIVISEDGVASAAVTMALRGLGFTRSANDVDGLKGLLQTP